MSTDCGACGRLRTDLVEFAQRERRAEVTVVCAGTHEEVGRWAKPLVDTIAVIPDSDHRLAARLGIGITPFLVACDDRTVVARGIVNDSERLEAAVDQIGLHVAGDNRKVQRVIEELDDMEAITNAR